MNTFHVLHTSSMKKNLCKWPYACRAEPEHCITKKVSERGASVISCCCCTLILCAVCVHNVEKSSLTVDIDKVFKNSVQGRKKIFRKV